jgi:hypothetical protein
MTRELSLYDVVRLAVDLPEDGLQAGAIGTVVEIFDVPQRAYEIEFADDSGTTIAQLALEPGQIEPASA